MAKKFFTHDSLVTLIDEIKSYVTNAVSSKAESNHTHSISNVTNLQVALDEKVPTSRTINEKELSSNVTLSASDVNAYSKSEIDGMEYISITSIDTICGSSLNYEYAEEVSF